MSPAADLEACVRRLVTVPCGIGVATVGAGYDALPDIERRAVATAVPVRRNGFAAGRIAARAALVDIGTAPVPLPRLENGRPQWPDGVVGSISHTSELAVAIVVRSSGGSSVGVDIESHAAVKETLWREILDERETAMVRSHPDAPKAAAAVFALKEAFYKFQHPITGEWLDFKDVSVVLRQNSEATVSVKKAGFPRLPEWLARFAFVGDVVVAVVFAG